MKKVNNDRIRATFKDYRLSNGITLSVKALSGDKRSGKRAIFIHGGGAGGNHTLMERPSRWMIDRGLFDDIILPDRRGAGNSSPLTKSTSISEQAEDMKLLLDAMGASGPITAIGASYGGPIALELAHIDSRVERVVLVAASPTLLQTKGIIKFLVDSGIYKRMMSLVFKMYVGKKDPMYFDMDSAYDRPVSEYKKIFVEGLQHTPKDRLESLLIETESLFDKANMSVSEDVKLDIPVLQIIGDRDEVWGCEMPEEYMKNYPKLKRAIIKGAIHKDVFFKADMFYEETARLLREDYAGEKEAAPMIRQ